MKIKVGDRLKSRKFWMGLGGAIAPIATQAATGEIGWTQALGMSLIAVVTYLVGQSAEDVAKHSRKAIEVK